MRPRAFSARTSRRRAVARAGLRFAAAVWFVLAPPVAARGQVFREPRTAPGPDYARAMAIFHDGDYATAIREFREAARSGVRSVNWRWIDGVCYYAMAGECAYRMGDVRGALQQFDAALNVLLANERWMERIEFPPALEPLRRVAGRPYLWGQSKRTQLAARVPDRLLSHIGRMDNELVLQRGGVAAPAQLYGVQVTEVARCTALALLRRWEILGPVCPHTSLASKLYTSLSRRPTRPNHWSQRWIDVQLGLAAAGAGRAKEAAALLEQSLLINGQFNHPLTGIALVGLGRLALEQGHDDAAKSYYFEATFAAAPYEQYGIMEDGFRGALAAHLAGGEQSFFQPLEPAALWARRYNQPLEAALATLAAENRTAIGEPAAAQAWLNQARRVTRRREMGAGRLGWEAQWINAHALIQQGDLEGGMQALGRALAAARSASKRLLRISLADQLYTSGAMSDMAASTLLRGLLTDPTAAEWLREPREALAAITGPPPKALQRWFEVALKRKEYERAVEAADQIRRRRFFATLPLGGRLLALRWIVGAPEAALPPAAVLQRQDLLTRYPKLAELRRREAAVRAALEALPLAPEDEAQRKRQAELLEQLGQLGAAQEPLLYDIALRREPADLVFPPPCEFESVRGRLQPGQLLMACFTDGRAYYVFLITHNDYRVRRAGAERELRAQAAALLKSLAQYEANQPVSAEELTRDAWKAPAARLLEQLTGGLAADVWRQVHEVILVPDGVLWCVPWAALQTPEGEAGRAMIAGRRIRLVPTVSLAMPDGRGVRPSGPAAVIVGQLFPRFDEGLGEATYRRLAAAMPEAVRLAGPLPAPPRVFGVLCPRLIVLDDLPQTSGSAYQWSPFGRLAPPGESLLDWLALPWGGPDQLVLPGYHTAAENSLQRAARGDDVFLASCALMANGARTILLSLWRTGGRISHDMVREFAQELPYASAADAWRRSVLLAMIADVAPEQEPRVKPFVGPQSLKASHPFFWAGYALLDTGAEVARDGGPDAAAAEEGEEADRAAGGAPGPDG